MLSLNLAWSVYFDDYLNVCGPDFVRRSEFVLTMFFQLLGWETSADKSLDYDSMCVVLGLQLNLTDAKLGLVFLCNTEKRKVEVLSHIDKALTQGFLDPSTSERPSGRLQFASCQVFDRRSKAALKLLAKTPSRSDGRSTTPLDTPCPRVTFLSAAVPGPSERDAAPLCTFTLMLPSSQTVTSVLASRP